MTREELMRLNGLTPQDFEPRDRVGDLEQKQTATEYDVDMLADTVLALCDILEGE